MFVDNYSKVITTYISEHCYLLVITTLAVKYLEDTNILMYFTNLHFYAKQVFLVMDYEFFWNLTSNILYIITDAYLGLWEYISGKSSMPMLQLLRAMCIVMQILMFYIQKYMKVKKKAMPTLHCGGIETRLSLHHLSISAQTKNYEILNEFFKAGIFL